MSVCAADAWSIARFCALVVIEAPDDDSLRRSLIRIRDVWIDTANECELHAGRGKATQRTRDMQSKPCRRAASIVGARAPVDIGAG